MKIDIKVTEILSRIVSINANSEEEAIQITKDMYKKEEIVLDYADFNGNVIIEEEKDSFYDKKNSLTNEVIKYLIKDEQRHYEELDKPNNHIYLTLLKLQKFM